MLYRILVVFFFIKQKTAYEMRISDWSSDVCSSDLSCTRSATSTPARSGRRPAARRSSFRRWRRARTDRKSVVSGKSVSVRVDLGGRRIIKNKNEHKLINTIRK